MAKAKKEITNKQLHSQIGGLAEMIGFGFDKTDERFEKMKKEITAEFKSVRGELADRFAALNAKFDNLESKFDDLGKRVGRIESDVAWIKEILQSHDNILKNSESEKLILVRRLDRAERELELIKKHLKIA